MTEIQYNQHTIFLSEEDADLATAASWRVFYPNPNRRTMIVAASVPAYEGDTRRKGNIYLHRQIAERAGIPAGNRVIFLNGSQLDLRRDNLADGGPDGRMLRARTPAPRPCSPPDVRRRKLGEARPPEMYEIFVACSEGDRGAELFPAYPRHPGGYYRPVGEVQRVPEGWRGRAYGLGWGATHAIFHPAQKEVLDAAQEIDNDSPAQLTAAR